MRLVLCFEMFCIRSSRAFVITQWTLFGSTVAADGHTAALSPLLSPEKFSSTGDGLRGSTLLPAFRTCWTAGQGQTTGRSWVRMYFYWCTFAQLKLFQSMMKVHPYQTTPLGGSESRALEPTSSQFVGSHPDGCSLCLETHTILAVFRGAFNKNKYRDERRGNIFLPTVIFQELRPWLP